MKKNRSGQLDGNLVYSTGQGRMCPACEKPKNQCTCGKQRKTAGGDGIVRVGLQTKGRKGKGVTVITGLLLDHAEMREIARRWKQLCGSGGTVKDGVIEIQGDHRDLLVEELRKMDQQVKRVGG